MPSSPGSCWPSPSSRTASSYPSSHAYRKPVCTAPPIPRLKGRRITYAPRADATSAVRSVDPSETTTTASPGSMARSSSSTRPTLRSSLNAGTIAIRFTVASGAEAADGALSTSVDTRPDSQPDELEQPSCTVAIRVLVEDALARAASELLGLLRIVEQVAVGV